MQSLQPRVDAVQWYEGMLLGPQHLQQLNLRWDTLLCKYLEILKPYFWGVSILNIDTVTLVNGKLRILELEAILPDGTFVQVKPTDKVIPELDLTVYVDQLRQLGPQMVHLAVPIVNPDGSNVTGDFPRFLSIPGTAVVDLNTGENPIYIPRLVPNISLVLADIPHPRYASFPFAQIEFKDESYQLTSFIPPYLQILTTSTIGKVLGDVLQRLRDKAAFLSENLKSPSGASADLAIMDENAKLLTVIVRQVPVLENLLGVNTTHPYQLYLALLELVGDLTALKRGQVAPSFVPYQHNDLYKSFDQVITFIVNMIDLIQENYILLPFNKFDRAFSLELQPGWSSTTTYLLSLRGSPIFGPKDLLQWAEGALIASQSILKNVRDRRILGADRQIVDSNTEFNVTSPQDGILLEVTNDPSFIKPDDALCLVNLLDTPETRPQEIILYVKKS